AGGRCTMCSTPTKEVAPYMTGAGPRRTSTWSTSSRLTLVSAGLKAPPHGTSSDTRRNASNSLRPQNSGTELAGPPSPPGATSTPATADSASRKSVAARAPSSLPVNTVTMAGTVSTSSCNPFAVTSTYSACDGGAAGDGEGEGLGAGAWATGAARSRSSAHSIRGTPASLTGGRDYYQG